MLVGAAVWTAIAAALVAWLAITQAAGPRHLPGVAGVARWFLQCWLGRFLLLVAWAGAGWHLFCQRP